MKKEMNMNEDHEDCPWEDHKALSPEQAAEFEAHNRRMIRRLIAAVETTRVIERAQRKSHE